MHPSIGSLAIFRRPEPFAALWRRALRPAHLVFGELQRALMAAQRYEELRAMSDRPRAGKARQVFAEYYADMDKAA